MENTLIDEEISIDGIEDIFNEAPKPEGPSVEDEITKDIVEEETSTEEIEVDSIKGDLGEEISEALEKEDKDKVVEVLKKEDSGGDTRDRVKELIELGLLEDTRIAITEEDTEGKLLSEYTDLTTEQIKTIISLQEDKKSKKISDSHISKDNLSDHHLKIIEIMRNGGDLSQVFQDPNQGVKRPFEGKDLTKLEVQREVAMTYYTSQKGHTQKEALALIKQKEADFELDTFSGDIVQAYNKAYDGYLDKVNNDKIKEKQDYKKSLADRKKVLTETFKEKGIRDNVYFSVIEGTTKALPDGTLPIHKALEDILANPKENYEVLLHLMDKKAFNEIYKINAKEKATEQVLRLFDSMPKDKARQRKEDNSGFASEIEEEISKIRIT